MLFRCLHRYTGSGKRFFLLLLIVVKLCSDSPFFPNSAVLASAVLSHTKLQEKFCGDCVSASPGKSRVNSFTRSKTRSLGTTARKGGQEVENASIGSTDLVKSAFREKTASKIVLNSLPKSENRKTREGGKKAVIISVAVCTAIVLFLVLLLPIKMREKGGRFIGEPMTKKQRAKEMQEKKEKEFAEERREFEEKKREEATKVLEIQKEFAEKKRQFEEKAKKEEERIGDERKKCKEEEERTRAALKEEEKRIRVEKAKILEEGKKISEIKYELEEQERRWRQQIEEMELSATESVSSSAFSHIVSMEKDIQTLKIRIGKKKTEELALKKRVDEISAEKAELMQRPDKQGAEHQNLIQDKEKEQSLVQESLTEIFKSRISDEEELKVLEEDLPIIRQEVQKLSKMMAP